MACFKVVGMSPRLLPMGLHSQLVLGSFARAAFSRGDKALARVG